MRTPCLRGPSSVLCGQVTWEGIRMLWGPHEVICRIPTFEQGPPLSGPLFKHLGILGTTAFCLFIVNHFPLKCGMSFISVYQIPNFTGVIG